MPIVGLRTAGEVASLGTGVAIYIVLDEAGSARIAGERKLQLERIGTCSHRPQSRRKEAGEDA